MELLNDVVAVTATGQVFANLRSFGRLTQEVVHLRLSPLERCEKLLPLIRSLLLVALLPRDFQVQTLCQILNRFGERQPFNFLHPRIAITTVLTHPASIRTAIAIRIHVHRWVSVFVKGAQTDIILTATNRLQLNALADQINEVRSITNEFLKIIRDSERHRTLRASRAGRKEGVSAQHLDGLGRQGNVRSQRRSASMHSNTFRNGSQTPNLVKQRDGVEKFEQL